MTPPPSHTFFFQQKKLPPIGIYRKMQIKSSALAMTLCQLLTSPEGIDSMERVGKENGNNYFKLACDASGHGN